MNEKDWTEEQMNRRAYLLALGSAAASIVPLLGLAVKIRDDKHRIVPKNRQEELQLAVDDNVIDQYEAEQLVDVENSELYVTLWDRYSEAVADLEEYSVLDEKEEYWQQEHLVDMSLKYFDKAKHYSHCFQKQVQEDSDLVEKVNKLVRHDKEHTYHTMH